MNTIAIDAIARALLYEGYMLYPYRPSALKNQQRFNFGVLYPRAYSDQQEGTEPWFAQTECMLLGTPSSMLEVRVRFLHLAECFRPHLGNSTDSASLTEVMEREIALPVTNVGSLTSHPLPWSAIFAAGESVNSTSHRPEDATTRRWQSIRCSVKVSARQPREGIFHITVRIENTDLSKDLPATRDQILMRSPISAHIALGVENGAFVSLLDPPETLRALTAECNNIGGFPVLVGDPAQRNTMLASPIILYDYPEIAPESAGDLFDGTEIDEILSLRILTLTDEEKQEIRSSDERARAILDRTDNLPQEQWTKLHGALRGLRPLQENRTR